MDGADEARSDDGGANVREAAQRSTIMALSTTCLDGLDG
jgi:hypothetical protein